MGDQQRQTAEVWKLPGMNKTVEIKDGDTVREALKRAEITVGSEFEIRVNDSPATLDTKLRDGDKIMIVKNIKGN